MTTQQARAEHPAQRQCQAYQLVWVGRPKDLTNVQAPPNQPVRQFIVDRLKEKQS